MTLPDWIKETIAKFQAPATGKVIIELELYQTGVTRMEIGAIVRVKADSKSYGTDADIQK